MAQGSADELWKSFASRSQALSWTCEKGPNCHAWVTCQCAWWRKPDRGSSLETTPKLAVGRLRWSQMLQNLRFIIQEYLQRLILFI